MSTVLIVEDDSGNMQVFCFLFHSQGFRVLEATTGKEALEAGKRSVEPLDLILCDLMLPDMSGTELALELVKSHPEAAILFVSGMPLTALSSNDFCDFIQLPTHTTDFLEKPFHLSALKSKVEALLNRNSSIAVNGHRCPSETTLTSTGM